MKRKLLRFAPLAAALLCLVGCDARPVEPSPTPTPVYTVTYTVEGAAWRTETVEEGGSPALAETPESASRSFLAWLDADGRGVTPADTVITQDTDFTALTAPALLRDVYYLAAEGGLFRPDDALTRQEAAQALYTLLLEKPAIPDDIPVLPAFDEGLVPKQSLAARAAAKAEKAALAAAQKAGADAETDAAETAEPDAGLETEAAAAAPNAYEMLAALCAAGYMDAGEDGALLPNEALTAEDFAALISPFFLPERVEELTAALPAGALCRADAAAVLNELLGRAVPAENADALFADIPEDDARLTTARAASETEAFAPGLLLLSSGRLYCIGEDGLCLRDTDVGTLHFGADGCYTSGSEELDALVRAAVAGLIEPAAEHEAQLRILYDYVRDCFAYISRNVYHTGEHGWELEEATNMLSTHYGNCYSFAAAFWSLARGIGYDAQAISGGSGPERAPHGWVYATLEDGVCYFFDPELEYASLRDGEEYCAMFKLAWSGATVRWKYSYNWEIEGFPPKA